VSLLEDASVRCSPNAHHHAEYLREVKVREACLCMARG
jgi:hypothetical protein